MPKVKKLPQKNVLEFFHKLPAAERSQLLQSHLSEASLEILGQNRFHAVLKEIQKLPEDQAKEALKDEKKLGASVKELLATGEKIAGSWLDKIYSKFAKSDSDIDKLYALLKSQTVGNRLELLWAPVSAEVKALYRKQGLESLNNPNTLGRYLEIEGRFAEGKSLAGFLKDVSKRMDMTAEKSVMETLREGIDPQDPTAEDKLSRTAQLYMLHNESKCDPEDWNRKLRDEDWEKELDPRKLLRESPNRVRLDLAIPRIKEVLAEIPETPEDEAIFREAALQTCRDFRRFLPKHTWETKSGEAFLKYANELQEQSVKQGLKESRAQELITGLADEQAILGRTKAGFLMSKTNTPEHTAMMDGLKLFQAKVAMLQGKEPLGLTEQETDLVQRSDPRALFDRARQSCYNYGCLKTKNGKGGFVYEAGETRFKSSMRALHKLNELGRALNLTQPAEYLQNEAQRELLEHRRDGNWLSANAANLAAKTMYAQTLMNKGASWVEQKRCLAAGPLAERVERMKKHASFKKMLKDAEPKGLADAAIKGVTHLAALHQRAYRATNTAQRTDSEISPKNLELQPDSEGVSLTL